MIPASFPLDLSDKMNLPFGHLINLNKRLGGKQLKNSKLSNGMLPSSEGYKKIADAIIDEIGSINRKEE